MIWKRLLRISLWSLVGLLLLALILYGLAAFTPLPDRIGEHLLAKALRESGGRLKIEHHEGTLARGLDLYGLELVIPGQVEVKAPRARLRLSTVPLLAGIIHLREVVLDGPRVRVFLQPGATGAKGKAGGLDWIKVRIAKLEVRGGEFSLVHAENGAEPGDDLTWSQIAISARGWAWGKAISGKFLNLSAHCPPPQPRSVSVEGEFRFVVGGAGYCDLSLASPESLLKVKGSWHFKGDTFKNYRADLDLEKVSLPEAAIGWEEAPRLPVSGKLRAEGDAGHVSWKGPIRIKDTDLSTEGEARWGSRGVTVSGEAQIRTADASPFWPTPQGREARVSGTGRYFVVVPPEGDTRWQVVAELGPSRIWGFDVGSVSGSASGAGAIADGSGTFSAPLAREGKAGFHWEGDAWQLTLSGRSVQAPEVLAGLEILPELPEPLKFPGGDWIAHRVEVRSGPEGISVAADLADPSGAGVLFSLEPWQEKGPVAWSSSVRDLSLAEWGLGASGNLTACGSFRGPGWEIGSLVVDPLEGEWEGVRLEPAQLRVHFTEEGARLEPTELRTPGAEVRLAGSFDRKRGATARVSARVDDLSRLGRFLGVEGLRGSIRGEADVSGPAEALEIRGSAESEGGGYGDFSVEAIRVEGVWDFAGPGSDLRASWSGASVSDNPLGAGSFTLRGPPSHSRLVFDAELGQGRRVALEADGSWGKNLGQVTLGSLRVEARRQAFEQKGTARVSWTPERLEWSGLELRNGEIALSAAGSVGLGKSMERAAISGTLRAQRVPLDLFPLPPSAGAVGGNVEADLSWSGTLESPSIRGWAQVVDGFYRFPASDLVISPIVLKMSAEGDRLVVTEATATTREGGTASAEGFVRFKGLLPDKFRLVAKGTDLPFVIGQDVAGRSSFQVTLRGTPTQPVLEGTAEVLKGRIQLPDLAKQEPLPSTIHFVNVPKGSPLEKRKIDPPGAYRLGGSVRLKSSGGLWVSNRSILAELVGDLTVRFSTAGPTIEGKLEVQSGRYLFQGRKFDLKDSRLLFNGSTDLLPYLDVRATYLAEDVEIEIRLRGNPNKPELQLASTPPMEKADILSTLLYGRRLSELTAAEQKQSAASAAILGAQFQAMPLVDSVRDRLKLDTLDVAMLPTGTEVGFSKYLGDRTVLEYKQIFGTFPEERLNLRYRINRHWSIQGQASSIGNSGLDVLWEKRY